MDAGYQDYEWYVKTDFSQYTGKWLAILDKKVVAVGRTIQEVLEKVKKEYPAKRPLVTKIRDKLSILRL